MVLDDDYVRVCCTTVEYTWYRTVFVYSIPGTSYEYQVLHHVPGIGVEYDYTVIVSYVCVSSSVVSQLVLVHQVCYKNKVYTTYLLLRTTYQVTNPYLPGTRHQVPVSFCAFRYCSHQPSHV